jgi:HD superfamily phosphohydrolase
VTMILKTVAEIRDPVHGYVKITDLERQLIDNLFVQRLRRIHQLAGAYLVYPGGVHTRFEHVLGTMHVAGLTAESLANKMHLNEDLIQEIRLAALLHDVGHGPFSHLFEEVLEKTNLTHEDISQRIVRETTIKDAIEKNGYSSRRISDLCVGKLNDKPFLDEIIAGGLSADMMDYLLRDSYFTGVEYGRVDIHRIIDSLDVVDNHLALDQAALYAFEALLIARYEMFKAVYFHRTVRAAELMLVHAMSLADELLEFTNLTDVNRYLKLTDEVVFEQLISLPEQSKKLRMAKKLAQAYAERQLLKCTFEKLIQRRDRFVDKVFNSQRFRQELAYDIARKANIGVESIYIDVPTTPSVPYTYADEELSSITLLHPDDSGKHPERVPIRTLPLVGSIAGFMDVLRVYTTSNNRSKVTRAIQSLFSNDGPLSTIPD